jgi:hypothetical protein
VPPEAGRSAQALRTPTGGLKRGGTEYLHPAARRRLRLQAAASPRISFTYDGLQAIASTRISLAYDGDGLLSY